jgi:nucleoid-associated protein YgaU
MRHGLGAALRLAGWTAGLVVAARLLPAAGSDSLSVPLTSLDELAGWVSDTPPADMTMALLRLAALAATWYLLAVTSLAVVARLVRVQRLRVAVDHISPSVVHRLVTGGSGIGLALGAVVGSLPAPDLASGPEPATIASAAPAAARPAAAMSRTPEVTATITRVPEVAPPLTTTASAEATDAASASASASTSGSAEATMTQLGDPAAPSATMTRLDQSASGPPAPGSPPAVSATPATYGADTASAATASGPPAVPEIDPTSWVVEPGDSLWSIASEVTSPPGGPAADERVVGRYWRRLVEANRAQLVDPDNADLLVPGQWLVVPPPPDG